MPKPPRKSNVSIAPATGDEGTPSKEKEKEKEREKEKDKERDGISIEDLSLPRTMVQRLAKGVLPPNTQIQKDAITAMSKGATVFVNHLSNAANQHTHASAKKTITPGDVLLAIRDLEFEAFTPRLEAELAKFNQVQTGKRNEYRRKVRESGIGAAAKNGAAGGDEVEADGERARKRVRREGGVGNGGGRMGVEKGGDETVDEDEGEGEGEREGEGEGEPEGEVGDDVEEEEEEEDEGSGEEGDADVDVADRDESASDEALDDAEDSD